MRAENNHRHRRAAHDQTQRLKPIQSRHFEVKRDYVRVQLFDFLQRECAVHCRADDLDGWIAFEDRGNKFPHERGIVDNEDSDALAHAMAPRGVARERRERTAGTFRISTTVPSPRMEAPLTRSLEMISVGSALITNSSSPTMLSTMRPKRFSAAPITMTKLRFFFLASGAATAWIWLRLFKRTRVRIWSRRRRT